ncbi:efflux RND transporter periplasmic adaptor subunit [Sandaracinus amylolyticus]|uniref:efflux RND transporter periplasmic adaptor subunit n=1 Tax=Sandaracinus amylolyticus TaxID=927083 RepID=UPI001F0061A0|nr:efflux RND transporter periplasmic adaptor subunit [Sandaracinus amylolyticus]UJR79526.1 Putative Co/Zn/Cd efflux system membrane fusion protein [Sandaracinus amylolyticus]
MRAGVVVLVGVLASACGASEAAAPAVAERGRLVVVEPSVSGVAEERVTMLGDVQGEVEVRVFAQVPERIRVLHVQEGDHVEAGDPIATLEADLQATGVAQAGAAVEAASSARDQLRADLDRATRLAATGAIPRAQVDALAAQLRASEAQVAQVSAAHRSAGAQRARTVIRAPVAGTVALLAVQDGDMVAPTMPICSVVRTTRVKVALRVTEQDWVRIREGMEVEIAPPALEEVVRRGTVSRVSPVIDRMTRTAMVEVMVDNADGVLRPGMVARAGVVLARREGVTMIAGRAVVMTPETDTDHRAVVFVAEGETARRRDVRIGVRYGERIEIAEGLAAGERVVVEGQHLLRDGAPIRVAGESAAGPG